MQILLPLVGALAAGGSAWLVSGNAAMAAVIGVACGFGAWLAQRRQAPPA